MLRIITVSAEYKPRKNVTLSLPAPGFIPYTCSNTQWTAGLVSSLGSAGAVANPGCPLVRAACFPAQLHKAQPFCWPGSAASHRSPSSFHSNL